MARNTYRYCRVGFVVILLVGSNPARGVGQSVTVDVVGDAVRIRPAGFRFIEGTALERLRDGRSLQVDFELAVLADPDGPVVSERRQSFNLSYDLWEERFSVSLIGTSSRAISHLVSADAEAWCLDQLMLPVAALGRLGRDEPFWIRLAYRFHDTEPAPDPDDDGPFTLRSLIDMLSRRAPDDEPGDSLDAGPFHLPN